jgi:hypothetical protein
MLNRIAEKGNMVVRKNRRLTRDRAKALIAAGLQRAVQNAEDGIEQVAAGATCGRRCLESALSHQTLPEAHFLFNALIDEPTVLDEVMSEVGYCVTPLEIEFDNDLELIAELSALLTEWLDAMKDGRRDHVELMRIAKRIRHLLPKLRGVVGEADKLRAVA